MQKLSLALLALLACAPPVVGTSKGAAPVQKAAVKETPITKVAGYVVRTETGEIVVDVPRDRQPTRHLHVVGVQLDAPRTPSRHLPDGSVDGSELLGALATTARRTEMRSSEMLVVLEGRQHPRRDAREIDLVDAIVVSKITKPDWTRAFGEYETRLARDLSFALQPEDATHARAADAIEHAESPILDLVRPAEASLLEIVRFWNHKRRYLHDLRDHRGGDALAQWASAELVEYNLENALEGRPQPTNTERDTYRELFAYAGVRLLDAAQNAEEDEDTRCHAALQANRLLDLYDSKRPLSALARELSEACDGR